MVGVALFASLSGCAVVARILATVDAVSLARDVADALPAPARPAVSASEDTTVQAVIADTEGAGLRLNAHPGADRLSVLPEGTVVMVVCQSAGPTVTGPSGESAAWSRVETLDGTGYMSNAYLDIDAGRDVPPC